MTYSTATLPSLRWLLAVPISAAPTGRIVPVADALDQLATTVTIDLGPALGADGPRPTGVPFARLRSFTRAAVIAATPLLSNVNALAERIAASSRVPPAADVLAAVAKIVGVGPLHAEIAAIYAPKPAPAPTPAPAAAGSDHAAASGELVDELLTAAPAPAAPNPDRPAAIIDALVRGGQAPAPSAGEADNTRAARERIAAAAARAADLALADPAVRAREALWRDLKLVHEQCANREGFSASVLDADPALVVHYLEQLAEDDPMARPDVVFVGGLADLDDLAPLAEKASDALVPVVVSLAPAALGRADLGAVSDLSEKPADIPPAWTDLRADANTRWLAAVTNPVVFVRDGARTVLGAPALTLAALMAASHRDTGGLASLARAGAFAAPLVADAVVAGQDPPPPTETLALLKTQGRLAGLGLIALGSPRTGESLVVAACPVVHSGADAPSLPAQILTGRIVRFALWVRAQIPPGAPAQAVSRLFAEASSVSLLPGLTREEGVMTAELDAENHQVAITARVHPAIAGAPLEIQFSLPVSGLA
ncbi:MAG: hypothetical protein JNL82_07850 [Myxococcales bacterium]|nr:hypothetical protein [Myxococcales bacterium]